MADNNYGENLVTTFKKALGGKEYDKVTYKDVYEYIGVSKSSLYRFRKQPDKHHNIKNKLLSALDKMERHVIAIAERYNMLIGYDVIASTSANAEKILKDFQKNDNKLEAVIFTKIYDKITPSKIQEIAFIFDTILLEYEGIENNRDEFIDGLIEKANLNKSWDSRLRNQLFDDEFFIL